MENKFQRLPQKFVAPGLQFNRALDLLDEGLCLILRNTRSHINGVLRTRPGLSTPLNVGGNTAELGIHSLKQLNDPLPGAANPFAIIAGAGNGLYDDNAAHTVFSLADTGYSGDPLTFVNICPLRSASPWTFVGDRSRKRKISVAGTDYDWGINQPNTPLTAALGAPLLKVVSECDATTESAVAWVQAGVCAAPTAPDRIAATAVTYILYDVGSSGWASVVPAAFPDDLKEGVRITTAVTTAETVLVYETFEQLASTEIESIAYDAGVSGLCTIVPKVAMSGLRRDMILRLAATENVRVLSVTPGPDGRSAFRCLTTGTRAANDVIAGLRSFRAYFINTHNTTTTFSTKCLETVTTGVGTGTLRHTLARDITSSNTTTGRAFTEDDEIWISFWCSDPNLVNSLRFMFDVDAATNTFTENYYYGIVEKSTLLAAISGTITEPALQQRILQQQELSQAAQRAALNAQERQASRNYEPGWEEPPPPLDFTDPILPGQTAPGSNQWTRVKLKIRDLKRVGSDSSRTLADVQAIQIQVDCSAAVTVRVDAWMVVGGYDLNIPDGAENSYRWTYRYRSSLTGAKSNFAPPMRFSLDPKRIPVVLTPTVSSDAQVDIIEYARFGGALSEYHLLGVGPNSGTFTDSYPDSYLSGTPIFDLVSDFQPFPSIDTPRTGICQVRGTELIRTGGTDSFNTSWAPGSIIEVNGVKTRLYASPTSATQASVVDNLGTSASATFYLEGATILNQNLPSIWGPYSTGGLGEFIFACGDQYLPGTAFWTNPSDPDTTQEDNKLTITSGSERLVMGCIYDGRSIVFSDKRYFLLEPVGTPEGGLTFIYRDIANSIGLWCRTGLCVGDVIYFIGKDGIYATEGGQPISLTDDHLRNIFPHEGVDGENVKDGSGNVLFYAPDFSKVMRLEYDNGYLYFDYTNKNNKRSTLVYNTRTKRWSEDSYFGGDHISLHYRADGLGVNRHYLADATNGTIHYFDNTRATDGASSITSEVRTGALSLGDPRAKKLIGDAAIDILPVDAGSTIIPTYYFDDLTVSVAGSAITGASRAQIIESFNNGDGRPSFNIALGIVWTPSANIGPSIYGWESSFIPFPEDTKKRTTYFDALGSGATKLFQGVRIRANTFGVAKTVEVRADDTTLIATLTVNQASDRFVEYAFTTPYRARMARLTPTDANPWENWEVEWIHDKILPDGVTRLGTWFDDGGSNSAKFLQGVRIRCNTFGVDKVLNVISDDGTTIATITVNHNGDKVEAFSFATPYVTHMMRLVPTDSVEWEVLRVEWEFNAHPDLATTWMTQPTSHDMDNYHHLRDGNIALQSTSDVTLTITIDGTAYSYTIPSTAGVITKVPQDFMAVKGLLHTYRFTSTAPFRIFIKDCKIRVGAWGRQDAYQYVQPFGDLSRDQGARI